MVVSSQRNTPLKKLFFDDISAAIELEHDMVFIKHKLSNLLWKYGKGLKSLKFLRKNVLRHRSEGNRLMFREVASYLTSGNPSTGELTEIII